MANQLRKQRIEIARRLVASVAERIHADATATGLLVLCEHAAARHAGAVCLHRLEVDTALDRVPSRRLRAADLRQAEAVERCNNTVRH